MKKIVVWGASGHALVVADVLRLSGRYEIAGFLDDVNPAKHKTTFCGAIVLGGREQLDRLHAMGVEELLIAIGDCDARLRLAAVACQRGFRLATAVHSQTALARDIALGQGSVVCAGVVVNPGSRIGENVILNTCASVDHEGVIEDGVHLAPGVHLGGRVFVGRGAWVGIGATVKDGVVIGARSLIGAGAVVLEDVPEGVVAYGAPAKVIRKVGDSG